MFRLCNIKPKILYWTIAFFIAAYLDVSLCVSNHQNLSLNSNYEAIPFKKRLECYKKIETIYWNKRLWPKENVQSKPSFGTIFSDSLVQAKVEDVTKKSNALEYYWQKPVTSNLLQTEIDRMARSTKQPDVLKEIWSALDNDPHLIAECLARPIIVEKMIRSSYSFDKNLHSEIKKSALEDIAAFGTISGMKRMKGAYSEVELARVSQKRQAEEENEYAANRIVMDEEEWNREVQQIAQDLNSKNINELPVGRLSTLKEDENQFYTIAVLNKSEGSITLAMMRWNKRSFESWWNEVRGEFSSEIKESSAYYTMPDIIQSCQIGSWNTIAGTPQERTQHTAVWTGTEMIVWGGIDDLYFNDGGRYNPIMDTWFPINTIDAPPERIRHTAIWTGTEMIVWGAYSITNTGGRYNPMSDTWTATSLIGAPSARYGHSAIWTGTEMIIWGGYGSAPYYTNTGGRYNPPSDTWTATSLINVPSARFGHTAVWTGAEMIIWGGTGDSYFESGGRYNPNTDVWTATSLVNPPSARYYHTAVWTGSQMIIWGGRNSSDYFNTGSAYYPSLDVWIDISALNAPVPRGDHTAIWSGTEMIIWGGYNGQAFNTGGKYNPSNNKWTAVSMENFPLARYYHTAVWTGTEMIVWGGSGNSGVRYNSGSRYNPTTDSWVPTGIQSSSERYYHAAVWTGTEMIIWGGTSGSSTYYNSGARYYPATDNWVDTSVISSPMGRYSHTAVWTGIEMIVWGGYGSSGYASTGGRYNPSSDTWTATSTTNAPAGRYQHTSIWTGTEMIIWGGQYSSGNANTGGKYNPSSDTWNATSSINAPQARYYHTAVWTGTEMIIWGGTAGSSTYYYSGGKYNPAANSWIATSLIAPSARSKHTAIWTGEEMIIWGGLVDNTYFDSGAAYDPLHDIWHEISAIGASTARSGHTAVWTGPEMIVWGGMSSGSTYLNSGGIYNSKTDNWNALAETGAPSKRTDHTAIWTGEGMIVWGGHRSNYSYQYPFSSGALYCACDNISPVNVNAVSTGLNEITITWSAVPSAIGYNIYRRYELCSKQKEELIASDITSTNYIDTTVSGSTTYEYSVSAITQCESSKSNWAAVTATGDCALIPCFDGVQNVINDRNTNCSMTVQWNAATSNCSSYPDITYTVYRGMAFGFPLIPVNQIATCLTGTSFTDTAMVNNTTYYYAVRAEDSKNADQGPCNGGNIDDNEIRKSNSPTGPLVELINDDFESGLGNWTVSSNWNWNSTQAHSGTHSAHSGNVNNQLCDTLRLTNAVNLPANIATTLYFWTMHQTQYGYDAGIVEGSSNGSTWTKLSLQPAYPGTTYSSAPACLGPSSQSAFTGTNTTWTQYTSDVTSLTGGNFRLRFNYASNSSTVYGGWWVDDIKISYIDVCTSVVNPPGKVLNTLMVSKSNEDIVLNWNMPGGTCTVAAFSIYRGLLPFNGYNHAPLQCNVNNTTYQDEHSVTTYSNYYYLVVPHNALAEGSYGTDSSGSERPQSTSACKTSDLTICN